MHERTLRRPRAIARSLLVALLVALSLAACAPDKEAADRQFQDLLDELSGQMPSGKGDFFGSIKDLWNGGKATAERLWICKVLRPVFGGDPEGRRTVYVAGAMLEGTVGGVTGIYGRENAYDLHHYQAAGYRFYGGGLASELLAAGASLYEGVGVGNHGSVLDLVGPRGQVRGGVQLPVGIAKVGVTLTGFHQRPRPDVSISGALLGITGQLTATPHVPSVKGVAGLWTGDPEDTAALAARDTDLGARQHYLPASCAPTGKRTYLVQYGQPGQRHAERGEAMAKALLRAHGAARFSPVTRALSVSVAALGVARDNGGFDYLCNDGAPTDGPPPSPRPGNEASDAAADCAPVAVDPGAPSSVGDPDDGRDADGDTDGEPDAEPTTSGPGTADPGTTPSTEPATDPSESEDPPAAQALPKQGNGADDPEPGTDPSAPAEADDPVVRVAEPRDGSQVESPFDVEVMLSAASGTGGVVLMVDGQYYTSWSRPPYRARVALEPGSYEIKVVVEDPSGAGFSDAINVEVVEPAKGVTASDPAQTGPAAPEPPAPGPAVPAAPEPGPAAGASYEGGGISTGCALSASAPAPVPWALLPLLLALVAGRRRRAATALTRRR